MIKLFSDLEFSKSKSCDMLPCKCIYCDKVFYKKKKLIRECIFQLKKQVGNYCSNKCAGSDRSNSKEVKCKNCLIKFKKQLCEIKKSLNHFCSRNCAATYNNTHKTKGIRKSKLEIWIESQLKNLYPNLNIIHNGKKAIHSELDIYIPSLKLAFELNGIFHYEPIYGTDKLLKIQNNDKKKFESCIKNKIDLVVVNTSDQTYFKPKKSEKYLTIITEIINNNLERVKGFEPSM